MPLSLIAALLLVQAAPGDGHLPDHRVAPAASMPGREADARVAAIAFRLAVAARPRCSTVVGDAGFVLQHLSDFELADRAGVAAALALARGPGVIAIVPGGAADVAGVRLGDVLLAIDGISLPLEPGLAEPFSADRARTRADDVHDVLARPGPRTVRLDVLRDGARVSLRIDLRAACASQVRLARSGQRNAYADGRHVFLTTGLLALLRNDDELAFVLAHEMAHNISGHAAVMRGGEVRHGIGRTLGRSGQIVRDAEAAADALAGALMLEAGFDPLTGIMVLRRLGGMDLGLALFSDHASTGARIAAMRTLVEARR